MKIYAHSAFAVAITVIVLASGSVARAVPQSPVISVVPQASEHGFTVNITVDPRGMPVYAVQYELTYNTSVLKPDTQRKGAFLGGPSETIVVINRIEAGKLIYGETRKGIAGVKDPGTLSSVRFTPIGDPGDSSPLNLSEVIIVNPDTTTPYNPITVVNSSVTLYDKPPVILSASPPSPVNDFETAHRTFRITLDQIADVRWEINGTEVWTDRGVIESSYTNTSATIGTWEVSATAYNHAGSDRWRWIWKVSPLPRPRISVERVHVGNDSGNGYTVNITVDPRGMPVYAVQYELTYNSSVVKPEWQVKGAFLGDSEDTIVIANKIEPDRLIYGETRKGSGSVKTEGTLSCIRFSPVGKWGDSTALNLSNVIIANPDGMPYQIEVINTSIVVNNTPPVAIVSSLDRVNNAIQSPVRLSACRSYDPDPAPEPRGGGDVGVIRYVRWDFGDGATYQANGNFTDICAVKHIYPTWKWRGGPGGHYEPFNVSVTIGDGGHLYNTSCITIEVYMPGDTNGDGRVNIQDAVRIGRHFGEIRPGEGRRWGIDDADAADLNNDGRVNIQDAVIMGSHWGSTAW